MVVVLEEGYHPLLLCPKIYEFSPWMVLNGRHPDMAIYTMGVERKIRRHRKEESQASMTVTFQNYGIPLKMVTAFKYPWQFLTASDYTP